MKFNFVSVILLGALMTLPQVMTKEWSSEIDHGMNSNREPMMHAQKSTLHKRGQVSGFSRPHKRRSTLTVVKRCQGGDSDLPLDLDCILRSVKDLVDMILGSEDDGTDGVVGGIIHDVLKLVSKVVRVLHIRDDGDDGLLGLDSLIRQILGECDDDDLIEGEGDDGDLVGELLQSIRHLLHQLLNHDDGRGLVTQLVKTVEHLLRSLLHGGGRDDLLRKRFTQIKQRSRLQRRQGDLLDGILSGGAISGILSNIQDALQGILENLTEGDKTFHLVQGVLDDVTGLLGPLGLNGGNDNVLHIVKVLVKDVSDIIDGVPGGDNLELKNLLSKLVDAVIDLVVGLHLLQVIDLTQIKDL
ncbi:hypothetical protein DM01DRAFT_1016096 [Hesseltinella vesiculosa]|uniref:Uncharacterized protein n=1 Tax=Hesseltinella vesiculosa TaxID=101127 RepID=A0A1X2GKS7_9FUNG|nr:hypothetical protein DM01DRAFT_1016096 [Hesseltinella vesiculosa]